MTVMLTKEKLNELQQRLNEIDDLFLDQNLVKDQNKYKEISKERSELVEILDNYDNLTKVEQKINETETLLSESSDDAEFKELASEEM
ncbi:MAG: PCRF domain-containing protein, partial [Spirochaetes bacterium]|nr:PCRF domain-containing protein [Spirochaetota bacterium]